MTELKTFQIFVDGKWQNSKSGEFFESFYPFTEPATSPLIKNRCREKKINNGTVIDIKAPVVKISQFSP